MITCIGDCIVDTTVDEDGRATSYPGGAGLNLAIGVSLLGARACLIARVGADAPGFSLRRHLRERNVRLIETPNADYTGVAYSRRVNGEPVYAFNPPMFRRRFAMTQGAQQAIAGSAIVAVNSFPFEAADQVASLVDALGRCARMVVIDPNPRAALVPDVEAFRAGLARVLTVADVLKISEEDVHFLFSEDASIDPARLPRGRAKAVLLTRGAEGASLLTADGLRLDAPAAVDRRPVVDTMGAGDATLASVLTFLSEIDDMPRPSEWSACLERAMAIAAATCRSHGATLRLPEGLPNDDV